MYGCTGVQVPPPFIHFIPMPWAVLACGAILSTTGNYWNHLELLGFSWMCPTPSTWNAWLHWCAGPPPFIHFIPMLWAVLACVAILPTTGNYWNHLELLGFSWMCPTPSTWNVWLHWCAGPPPFHTFYSHALGCVGMRCHSPYSWKLLEPPGTPKILLDVPRPQYLKCMAALVCRSPPLSYILFPCSGLCWDALPFSLLLETINYWNHLELLGFSWMCPTPSTWNVWLHWCAGPPLSYILFPCSGLCWDALPFSLLLETIGTTWNS